MNARALGSQLRLIKQLAACPARKGKAIAMKRIGRVGKLKPGAAEEYIRLHKSMDAALLDAIRQAGIRNFSIYIHDQELFSYLEVADWDAAMDYLDRDRGTQEWSMLMRTLLDEPLPWEVLEEVFHVE
jgi:L-rhamnose mutarotase